MPSATLSQGKHLAETFEGLESGQLQALFTSGLLGDLKRCAAEFDPTKVDREAVQRALGIDPSVFRVTMGAAETTDEIAALWRASNLYVNDYITQANFPLNDHDRHEAEIVIVDPGKSFTEEEGLSKLSCWSCQAKA